VTDFSELVDSNDAELRKYLDANAVLHNSLAYEKTMNELNALIEWYNTLLNVRLKDPGAKLAPKVH
jgi:hypothetical protein